MQDEQNANPLADNQSAPERAPQPGSAPGQRIEPLQGAKPAAPIQPLEEKAAPDVVQSPTGGPVSQPVDSNQVSPGPNAPLPGTEPTTVAAPDLSVAGSLGVRTSRKKMFSGIAAALAVLILGGSYFVFMYLPNTPDAIYRRGLASIGVGLDELVDTNLIQSSEATEFTGEINVTKPIVLTSQMEGTASLDGDGNFSIDTQWDNYNPKLDIYYSALKPQFPQFYFKFSGLSDLVDDSFGPGAFEQLTGGRQLEGVWWLLDYEELVTEGYLSQGELDDLIAEAESQDPITTEDYVTLTRALIEVSNEYLFTSDSSKMVLQRSENLGVEEYEGVESQKYLVEVNKENLKAYLKAARDKVIETGVWDKMFPDNNLADELTDSDIDSAVDELDTSEVKIEAWVGLDNKVLRNVRFSPTTGEDGYVEVSLLLEGTDLNRIPLRMRFDSSSPQSSGRVDINWITDLAANTAEYSVDANVDDSSPADNDFEMDMKFTIKGLAKAPAYEVPSTSKSFIQLINDIAEDFQQVLGVSTDELKL